MLKCAVQLLKKVDIRDKVMKNIAFTKQRTQKNN
jgi:hypothetical protein